MGDNRCVELLGNHGRVRVLVTDTRGAISDDFTQFTKMCAKSAAEENWDTVGARNVHAAEQTYRQMFRRIVGVTVAREGAMWMRKSLAHFIDVSKGVPRGDNVNTWSRMRATQRRHTQDYLDCHYHGRNQMGFGRA